MTHNAHGCCGVSRFTRLCDYLITLGRFLDANPSETLTLLIEHTDGLSVQDVAGVFQSTGLDSRTYVKPACAAWPTLSQLGGRILAFSQDGSFGGVIQRLWSQGFDNPYSYDIVEGYALPRTCEVGRGTQSGLFLINHFITPPSSGITGSYSNGDRLLDQVDACEAAEYKTPNFIALDYYEQGSFDGGSFANYVASINARPHFGRAWDQG
ncbi:MAG: hypothetical protein ACI8TX_000437 [Hyphomicrobiaceae bacterium]|jgi:hypothetical protein